MMRQFFFILHQSPLTAKISLPPEWKGIYSESFDQLLAGLHQAQRDSKRVIVVTGENDCAKISQVVEACWEKGECPEYGTVVVSTDPLSFLKSDALPSRLLDVIPSKNVKKEWEMSLHKATRLLSSGMTAKPKNLRAETIRRLNEIFLLLSAERNTEKLLATILSKGIELSNADGGALFMIQEADGDMTFRYRIQDNGGTEVHLEEISTRVAEGSIAGFVALTGKTSNIDDIQSLRPSSLPGFGRGLDHDHAGEVVSLLTLPLRDSRNECRAVLQLANKREKNQVVSFSAEDEALLSFFGTQAAICLETLDVYGDVQRLFEGFVKAAITAIESRDPSTGGHSERVAKMCVGLARATTEVGTGIYRSVKFKEEEIKELEYAALLHDFGKIGVREEVLVKAKKLYSYQLDAIQERIKTCKAAAKIHYLEQRLKYGEGKQLELERQYQERVRQVDSYWKIIIAGNEPNVVKKENELMIDRIRNEQLLLPDGSQVALLTEEEYKALSIQQGSLTESERLEIESHVRHTHQFLKMIPWTRDFKHLTEIAYCHHEKLDGTGYPRGLTSHEIPLQSKIMTISDIFDALTAADRWYKEAVPIEKALDILAHEVKEGKLDPVLYEIFVEKKIYEMTLPKGVVQVA